MGSIIGFLGLLFLFLILKFIYDTYLTSNTDKRFEEFRETNPIEAAEIDPPSNEKDFNNLVNAVSDNYDDNASTDRDKSLQRLSRKLNCEISNVKDTYIQSLRGEGFPMSYLQELVDSLSTRKFDEALKYDIESQNTTCAIACEWTLEFMDPGHYEDRVRTLDDVARDVLSKDEDVLSNNYDYKNSI